MPVYTPSRHMPTLAIALLVCALAWLQPAGAAPILGQVDTFEDGLLAGWEVGPTHPAPPTNGASGGPAGADDNFMLLTALGGDGAGSRLSVFNESQWAGDYVAAGINSISIDLRNFGADDVTLWLLLAGPFVPMVGPANVAVTLDSVLLPAGGNWTHATFSLDPARLNVLLGTAAGALSQATELRLFHNTGPVFAGPPNSSSPVTAQVGVDNVRALALPVPPGSVPEPGTLALLGLGLAALGLSRRRKAD